MGLNFTIGSVGAKGNRKTGTAYRLHGYFKPKNGIVLGSKSVAEYDAKELGVSLERYSYELKNPFVVKNDSDFEPLLAILKRYKNSNAVALLTHINTVLKSQGYDGLILKPEAYKSEKSYETIEAFYGPPQIIIFDRKNVQKA